MTARHAYTLMLLVLLAPIMPTWLRWVLGGAIAAMWLLTFDERDDHEDQVDDAVLHITTSRWN